MAARHRRHNVKGPKPTWLVVEATPPAPSTGAARKAPAPPAYYSPLLLSPSVWQQKAQHTGIKKGRAAGHGHPGCVPASPRIGCMGQVINGGTRCSSSSARGGQAASRSGLSSEYAAGGGGLVGLLMGLFRRRRRTRGRKPRACCKVRDVPSDSSSSSGSTRSNRGSRAPACAIDPPLPVPVPAVRRAAREDNAPSLWERRRGVGKALEGLQLT